MYLNNDVLSLSANFTYLGPMILESFLDDDNFEKKRRNLSVQGNILIRKILERG